MGHRLAESSSLYLRQHAENPVDWHPWGPEAFEEARRRDVPVFISIGYSACHWCHVMAAESFADGRTAEALNSRFVAIKVDREEHPDVDDAYMAATQTLTGQGGWPMSVFALPDGRAFHAGTYFPPARHGRIPAFTEVLDAVHTAWTQRREEVEESAEKIARALGVQRRQQAQLALFPAEDSDPGSETWAQTQEWVETALRVLASEEDTVHGGFGAAPKFPPSPLLAFLLEESCWQRQAGGDPADVAGGLAVRTLEAMGRSALFDQLDGGFARYATDRAWMVPHFEKMLADNAQLLGHCARLSVHPAGTAAQQDRAGRRARATIGWLTGRMLTPEGLLAASLDADTVDDQGRHVEGGTYLFSDVEIVDAARAAGHSMEQARRLATLSRGAPPEGGHVDLATGRTLHFSVPLSAADQQIWESIAEELLSRRDQRPQPGRDEKVVAAWNATAIRSLAEAGMLWGEDAPVELAEQIAETLWSIHVAQEEDGRVTGVARVSHQGRAADRPGTLADHAELASACFALSSAAGARLWLERGVAVLAATLEAFTRHGEHGWEVLESLDDGLLTAVQDGPSLAGALDGPEPSPVASLAVALQLAEALGDHHRLRATDLLHHLPLVTSKAPGVAGASLLVARRAARRSPTLRLVSADVEQARQVRRTAALLGVPVEPGAGESMEGSAGSAPAGSVELQLSLCLNAPGAMVCLPPVASVEEALEQVSPEGPA
ncbi:thioredoxin domain-containing protein [Nesterenkonia sp. HG001]|uniref:thioredoxin domain-containing protein n=1 Tax=Nesterenkonia sp. HG001 TaxID=2983207 RepID=UPI002AC7BBB1|nr:thioredoxin domain-containing protein [Nesterenkonia sp. HG001]MDZ5076919.1 thioredoxin domain-containing protein [Nesterenkonia sp. HG001]